ncbi:unnamed protein product [[Candida] boidinii]|uniref:Unnamed protein product n=1 Tax=Candida boidinii TaxID=5477 RepID=A0A9W6WHZ3_CANBO|nr:unnamed protein product [[Candida] boidinii]GMF99939.1 unnamed protein product [[Candida] boidinii]
MSGGPVPIYKKYTTGSKGIWEFIRKTLTLVPNRSSGNPYVPFFRNPPPASEPLEYKDPRTIPAGDVVKNSYFKRDYRRNYPRISSFDQTKVSGLLTLGSEAAPRISIGDKGSKELAVFTKGEAVSLASTISAVAPSVVKGELLGSKGQPIVAPNLNKKMAFRISTEAENGMYNDDYPVRIFTSTN